MKRIVVLLVVSFVLLASGCSKNSTTNSSNTQAEPNNKEQTSQQGENNSPPKDQEHISITKDSVTVSVSAKPKYFSKKMIIPAEGMVVAGMLLSITNNSNQDLTIDPTFVTIQTTDKQTFEMSPEKTEFTGKGGFKSLLLPPSYKGGGLVLFEIPEDTQIEQVMYNDEQGHQFNLVITDTTSNI